MMAVLAAAFVYFTLVFGAGFLLGPVRVFWLEPLVGPSIAVLCEAPLLLAVMVLAARRVPSAMRLSMDTHILLLMGIGALVFQQAADFSVGTFLRGISPAEQLAQFASVPGMIYASLLLAFAMMPLMMNWKPRAR